MWIFHTKHKKWQNKTNKRLIWLLFWCKMEREKKKRKENLLSLNRMADCLCDGRLLATLDFYEWIKWNFCPIFYSLFTLGHECPIYRYYYWTKDHEIFIMETTRSKTFVSVINDDKHQPIYCTSASWSVVFTN